MEDPRISVTAEVSIYVHEGYRGQGLGQFLMTQALHACPALHVTTLLGFIFGHNTPSLRLFGRAGFHRWGCLPHVADLDGIERDLVIMGKRVDS